MFCRFGVRIILCICEGSYKKLRHIPFNLKKSRKVSPDEKVCWTDTKLQSILGCRAKRSVTLHVIAESKLDILKCLESLTKRWMK